MNMTKLLYFVAGGIAGCIVSRLYYKQKQKESDELHEKEIKDVINTFTRNREESEVCIEGHIIESNQEEKDERIIFSKEAHEEYANITLKENYTNYSANFDKNSAQYEKDSTDMNIYFDEAIPPYQITYDEVNENKAFNEDIQKIYYIAEMDMIMDENEDRMEPEELESLVGPDAIEKLMESEEGEIYFRNPHLATYFALELKPDPGRTIYR